MDCIETEKSESIAVIVNTNNSTETEGCSATLEENIKCEPVVSNSNISGIEPKQEVDIKVIYNKNKYDVTTTLCTTVVELKRELQGLLGVPEKNQKLMFKGLLRDDQTLGSAGITKGAKLMVVGSKPNDIIAVTSVTKQDVQESEKATSSKEPLCKQKIHRKVLDKGVPEDAMPGLKNVKEALPSYPLSGMLNKHGGKLRLTFKLEQDQLWLGTKERTEKLAMTSIKGIVSEVIEGFEQYHLMGIQLGPTEASRYWVYWVPAQYIDAIKDAILGKWQYF